jgi:hypothetical protein
MYGPNTVTDNDLNIPDPHGQEPESAWASNDPSHTTIKDAGSHEGNIKIKDKAWAITLSPLLHPFHVLDTWFAALEGDVDKEMVRKAYVAKQNPPDIFDEEQRERNHKSLQRNRVGLLPNDSFYATPFVAPTKSALEAAKIALLQIDRLTAIPPQDAMIAIGGPTFISEEGQGHFQLFVTKKKTLSNLRRSDPSQRWVEAFVALDLHDDSEENTTELGFSAPVGGVFRDETGLARRANRRLFSASLLGLCSLAGALFAWSLQQRFDRQASELTAATRAANQVKVKTAAARAQALSELSAFGQGATTSSADRVLVTLSDMAARAPNDTRLQLIEIRQDKVRLKGAAKDANAARIAFSTPKSADQVNQTQGQSTKTATQGPAVPFTPPTPPPAMAAQPSGGINGVGAPTNQVQSAAPVVAQAPQQPWQNFDFEIAASTVRTAPSQVSAPNLGPPQITPAYPPQIQGGGTQ